MKKILLWVPLLLCAALAACNDDETRTIDSAVVYTADGVVNADVTEKSVTLYTTCGWSATGDTWITVTPEQGAQGIHAVKLSFGANDTGALRTGTVTFTAGSYKETYTLSQKAE